MKLINVQTNGTLQFDPYDPELPSIEVTDEEADKLWNGELIYQDGILKDVSELILLENLRQARDEECFPIINRGKLWYDSLTEDQANELQIWYNAWLNVTDTKVVPEKPTWLK